MNVYRVELVLKSGLGTPLAADTLWGHIAWGLRYRQGPDVLMDWLAAYDTRPPLILSDPLPSGFWPLPVLPRMPYGERSPSRDEAQQAKRIGKARWLSHAAWQTAAANLSPEVLATAMGGGEHPTPQVDMVVAHAGVNRFTGGTAQQEGGTLHFNRQSYYETPQRFDVFARSPESIDVVRAWFDDGLAGGYGRDAASGLGQLEVLAVAPFAWPSVAGANGCLLLGPVVPRPADPNRGFFVGNVKSGRVGGDFAIGLLPDGSSIRQKKPIHMLLAGTVLAASPPPDYVGRLIAGVHPTCPEIRHCGLAPTLPCRLAESLLHHPLLAAS